MLFHVTTNEMDAVREALKAYTVFIKELLPTSISVHAVVGYEKDFRLCEMFFQLNYDQYGSVCTTCLGEGKEVCGHLSFTN